MKSGISAIVLLLAGFAGGESAQSTVPCEILSPVFGANQVPMTATAPNGNSYPIFRVAAPDSLVLQVQSELEKSFAQEALRLDRYARNLLIARRESAHEAVEEWLTAPMYLLMSSEEGGFARFGFWLEDADGKRRLVLAGYVDLVVSRRSLDSGGFEEIFPHELGHLILKGLTGGMPNGLSRKMHQSMTITDYPTAFDEGYAEHYQALARDRTENRNLRKFGSGTVATDLELLWLSAADGQLRTDGVRRNLFIHRKPLPSAALNPNPELYRLFLEQETSTAFLPTELKSGQQMMASEGVIATLFYRIVNDEQICGHYREKAFYQPFLGASRVSEKAITPYENANIKLFAAIAELQGLTSDEPPMILLVEKYANFFPDEARRIYTLFIETTWGATVSQQLALQLEHAAEDGGRGDIAAFRKDQPFPLLDSTIEEVVAGKRPLNGNLGPELWIVNANFLIARAPWSTERDLPLTMNLNTATETELLTIPGVDLETVHQILTARQARGYFQGIGDASSVITPAVSGRLKSMADQVKQIGPFQRD